MKTTKLIVSSALCFLLLCACDKDDVRPGDVTTVTRPLESFREIEVGHAFEVRLTLGEEEKVVIEAPQGYIPYINTQVTDHRLKVTLDRKVKESKMKVRKLHIYAKSIDRLSLSGATDFECMDTIQAGIARVDLNGSSTAVLTFRANSLSVAASGASKVTLDGMTDLLSLGELSGSSTAHAFGLQARDVSVSASGASEAQVYAQQRLTVNASGASHVWYRGGATVSSDLSGGSQVINSN